MREPRLRFHAWECRPGHLWGQRHQRSPCLLWAGLVKGHGSALSQLRHPSEGPGLDSSPQAGRWEQGEGRPGHAGSLRGHTRGLHMGAMRSHPPGDTEPLQTSLWRRCCGLTLLTPFPRSHSRSMVLLHALPRGGHRWSGCQVLTASGSPPAREGQPWDPRLSLTKADLDVWVSLHRELVGGSLLSSLIDFRCRLESVHSVDHGTSELSPRYHRCPTPRARSGLAGGLPSQPGFSSTHQGPCHPLSTLAPLGGVPFRGWHVTTAPAAVQ